MIHPHQHIVDLSAICARMGVGNIIISPGSRNAPLTNSFFDRFGNACYSIVDERSAAYVALGMSRNLREPAALISTSGTAVLNYSPAIAEAYYQRIPLIVITADRPAKWIDQQDNQTIRQQDVYRNFIIRSISLPEEHPNEASLQITHRHISEIILLAKTMRGPVHINVPLDEPLYKDLPQDSPQLAIDTSQVENNQSIPSELLRQWKTAERILIIYGQELPDKNLQHAFETLLSDSRVVAIAENISNLFSEELIDQPELLLGHVDGEKLPVPDFILYAGGQVVSKRLKTLIRKWAVPNTWRVGIDAFEMDTFCQQNKIAKVKASAVFTELSSFIKSGRPGEFRQKWQLEYWNVVSGTKKQLEHLPFSDVFVTHQVLEHLNRSTIIELGNSSIIRYTQLLPGKRVNAVYSNRGVSGIDGCLSAAVGTALTTQFTTVAILGDLTFLYDSNALWNRRLPGNLKIVVLNNRGGGIFGLIPGPSAKPAYTDFFLAHHPVKIQKLAEAFNLNYFCARNSKELSKHLPVFLQETDTASLLEINTEHDLNKEAFNRLLTGK